VRVEGLRRESDVLMERAGRLMAASSEHLSLRRSTRPAAGQLTGTAAARDGGGTGPLLDGAGRAAPDDPGDGPEH